MIIKFSDKVEDTKLEGDIEMGRKSNKDKDKDKDRFSRMDVSVVNSVKEEVLGMVNETQSQVAVGFNEVLEDEDMVQKEMELVKEMDAEVDDEKLKQQMRELNMRNMPSLSNLSRIKNEEDGKEGNGGEEDSSGEGVGSDKEQMVKDEFNEEYSDAQRKKDELAKKRELRKLKQELKQNDLKLKESTSWSFSPVIPFS